MRLIDAEFLERIKFHPLPYTHIVPSDTDAESYKRGWNDAIDAIMDNVPSAQPERKTGKWIRDKKTEKEEQLIFHKIWMCSKCGEQQCRPKPSNFCPNCGAKMEVADGK